MSAAGARWARFYTRRLLQRAALQRKFHMQARDVARSPLLVYEKLRAAPTARPPGARCWRDARRPRRRCCRRFFFLAAAAAVLPSSFFLQRGKKIQARRAVGDRRAGQRRERARNIQFAAAPRPWMMAARESARWRMVYAYMARVLLLLLPPALLLLPSFAMFFCHAPASRASRQREHIC